MYAPLVTIEVRGTQEHDPPAARRPPSQTLVHNHHQQETMADAAAAERAPLLSDESSTSSWRDAATQRWHRTTSTLSHWAASTKAALKSSSGGGGHHHQQHEELDEDELERRLRRKTALQRTAHIAGVTLFALALALLVLGAILLGHLFIITLKPPSEDKQSAILTRALTLKGPDRLSLLNLTSEGVLVQLDARLGLDPDEAFDEWLGVRGSRSAWQNIERRWLEWGFRKVKGIRIDIVGPITVAEPDWSRDLPRRRLHLIDGKHKKKKKQHVAEEDASVWSNRNSTAPPADLLDFAIEPLYIRLPPLRSRSAKSSIQPQDGAEGGDHPTHRAEHNLTPLNLTLLLKPLLPVSELAAIVEAAAKKKKATLDINVPGVTVRGLGERDMREGERRKREGLPPIERGAMRYGWGIAGWLSLRQGQTGSRVTDNIPDVNPGNDTSKLLDLTHYDFFEIGGDDDNPDEKAQGLAAVQNMVNTLATRALGIRADAIAQNPLGSLLHGRVRYQLPFGVYLPIEDEVPTPPGGGGDDGNGTSVNAKKQRHGDPDDTSSVLMAVVATEPIELDGSKHIPLKLQGRVIPPPPPSKTDSLINSEAQAVQKTFTSLSSAGKEVHTSETPQERALSNFLSKFLRGDANTVYVRGGSPWARTPTADGSKSVKGNATDDLPGDGSPDLPEWISSALNIVDLPISFPGSKVTDLIKDVTISDLRFTAHPFEKERILCSGTVMGVLNLPKELGGVDVKVTELWPDILVFDGKPPSMRKPHHGDGDGGNDDDDDDDDYYDDDDDDSVRSRRQQSRTQTKDDPPKPDPNPIPPLPSPLPDGAFGRLRPHDFTPATTGPDPNDPTGARKLMRSELVNVPFTVLPDRQREFRAFAWKIITGGAKAGIEGSARARIWNSGLGVLELYNLPVKGTFPVNPPSSTSALAKLGLTAKDKDKLEDLLS
ncbi:hypothetical protein V8E36_001657 [Tilletia maclaganii]